MIDPSVIGAAVGSRLSDVMAVMERQSAFAYVEDAETPAGPVADDASVTRDFVLRALAAGTDCLNYAVMFYLANDDQSHASIAAHVSLGEAAVWERLNDLIQVGLVARDLEHDRVGLTGAGIELVHLVEGAASAARSKLEAASL